MNQRLRQGLLYAFIMVALGVMFLYAGFTKIVDPAGFSLSVYNYHLLPGCLVNIAAILLPWKYSNGFPVQAVASAGRRPAWPLPLPSGAGM